jgi:nicotinamide phosphoribosyltransferase
MNNEEKFVYPATLLCDFYKVSHRDQYPEGTEKVYSTWTPRTSRIEEIDSVVAFGFQGFIKKYLIDYFNENFFGRCKEDVVAEYVRYIENTLGVQNPSTIHIEEIHDLGYLPIKICAVEEGTKVPIRVPMLTIENTLPENGEKFFWITNYIETLLSCELWMPMTSATLANEYKKILLKYAKETGGNIPFVDFQGHDFSMRGMSSLEAAKMSGAGHLLSFTGTDTIPAIMYLEQFYNANIERELVGASIPATEHSVMCAYGNNNEFEAYKRIITEIYPNGFVSIVSDTWDLWKVLTEIIDGLKPQIMARDGKVVIRPDSGDPVKIICGDPTSTNYFARRGVVELLWNIFGGTTNAKGYKELDSHIGCIYGDAITLDRCRRICEGLMEKGFASTNTVFGIGSYTYQYNTRDTFGFALKSTYAVINGKEVNLFKDPITDNGVKKSQTGLVAVTKNEEGVISFTDGLTANDIKNHYPDNLLIPIFENGVLLKETSLLEIRNRLAS